MTAVLSHRGTKRDKMQLIDVVNRVILKLFRHYSELSTNSIQERIWENS